MKHDGFPKRILIEQLLIKYKIYDFENKTVMRETHQCFMKKIGGNQSVTSLVIRGVT